ncbi:MAG TPA: BtrH N-terminal domain-containing protein [Ktedonobacteraceae bacterium]
MTIPMVPFAGEMSYCLIKSMQMVLAYRGREYPIAWLETVSGEPFGFVYIRDKESFFAVDGYAYHEAGEHLLRTLNYSYTYTGATNDEEALARLEGALKSGPVVVGMLDMGYLTYMPEHRNLRGVDHAIVVLALQPDVVVVHDPAGYVAVPLPLDDFLAAWQRDIYTGKPYGLWQIGQQGEAPADEAIWQRTLARARENFKREAEELFPGGPIVLYGPAGMRSLASDIQSWPKISLGMLPHFSWRVSGQRCQASAAYLHAKLPEAAAIRWEESQLYGQLQRASAFNERAVLCALLEQLAEREEAFIAALLA